MALAVREVDCMSRSQLMVALRVADQRFHEERDRRYAEVALARAEALKIKDEGDKEALRLAREIQTYKDEKANELREQIGAERGLYATKDDLVVMVAKLEAEIKPLDTYVAGQQGGTRATDRRAGASTQWRLAAFAFVGSALLAVGGAIVTIVITLVVLAANGKLG
jgi:vacuolar-type H+-ATPase subunit H